jgi:hypothetical protein
MLTILKFRREIPAFFDETIIPKLHASYPNAERGSLLGYSSGYPLRFKITKLSKQGAVAQDEIVKELQAAEWTQIETPAFLSSWLGHSWVYFQQELEIG